MIIDVNHLNNTYPQVKEPEKFWWGLTISVFFSKPIFFTYFQIDKMEYKRKQKQKKKRDLGKGYIIMKDEILN